MDIRSFQTLFLEASNDKSGVVLSNVQFCGGLETLLRLLPFLFLVFILPFCRVEKKAIHGIINMNFSEQSKTYHEEDLSITVVKMNLSTTNDFVQIAAPGVRLLPHTVYAKSPS